CADLESDDAVDIITSSSQHQNRNARTSANASQYVEAVCARQHHVEHHQIVFVRQRTVDALFAVVDRFNRVTFRLKIFAHQLEKADVVVDYQHVFHWLLYSKIERHMDDLRQAGRILCVCREESYSNRPFSCVKKCQSSSQRN